MRKLTLILFILIFHNTYSQWYQQQSPLPPDKIIWHIDFVDADKGWGHTSIATENDTSYVIRTTNGGSNWFVQYFQKGLFIDDMEFINDTLGYLCGFNGLTVKSAFLKTTNGGVNWNETQLPFGLGFDDMFFLNKDTGWVCLSSAINGVWFTSDGGTNWERRTTGLPSNQGAQRIYFINGRYGYCGNGVVYRTTNCGVTWLQNFETAERVYSFCFTDSLNGFMGYGNSFLARTTNAGANWDYRKFIIKNSGTIKDIQFINSNTGWLIESRLFKTTNGGLNWGTQVVNGQLGVDLSIVDSSIGYNTGLLKTTNGGGAITSAISQVSTITPENFKLYQNYPNPFNPSTKIKFSLKSSSLITLFVYDINGKEIYRYEYPNKLNSGTYETEFKALSLPSGTYIYKIRAYNEKGINEESKKMMLVK